MNERPEPVIHRGDLVVAVVFVVACAGLFAETTNFERVSALPAQNVGPRDLPQGLLILIAALCVALPFERWLRGGRHRLERAVRFTPMVGLSALVLVAVVALHGVLGTWLTMLATCLALPLLWGERRWLALGLYAALFPLAVALLFGRVLEVVLLPGVFDITFY